MLTFGLPPQLPPGPFTPPDPPVDFDASPSQSELLANAVRRREYDNVQLLLSRGAAPDNAAMVAGAEFGTPAILQLLLDAGGSVNNGTVITTKWSSSQRKSLSVRTPTSPLFVVLQRSDVSIKEGKVSVLLGHPCLNLTATWTPAKRSHSDSDDDHIDWKRQDAQDLEEQRRGRCTLEQAARHDPTLVAMIAAEVSGRGAVEGLTDAV